MRRVGYAFVLQGCLCVGDPTYGVARSDAPQVTTDPDIFGAFDGGTIAKVQATQTIKVIFSEPMDANSLRAGISVQKEGEDVPIGVAPPPHTPGPADPMRNPDLGSDFEVRVSAANGAFPSGRNRLILRTLLVDDFGVPLAMELNGPFDVQP